MQLGTGLVTSRASPRCMYLALTSPNNEIEVLGHDARIMEPVATEQPQHGPQHPLYTLLPLVNSASAAADLIVRATSTPDLFTFAYLLHAPAIVQHLDSAPDKQQYMRLLRIFASGTWKDYVADAASLPPLSEAQTTKLKQLSLVSLASKSHTLAYARLLDDLALSDTRALASLVVSCIYANLIAATLDTRQQLVHVSAVIAGRDIVDTSDVARLRSVIDTWSARCEATIKALTAEAQTVRRAALKESKDVREYNRTVDAINKQIRRPLTKDTKDISSGGIPVSVEDATPSDVMEVDDESPRSDTSASTKKRKQGIRS
ncbi:uncharacterized protein V1518DRAFT_415446 [Limtongia smithiae]|uniref:uncharacterized protein n=1 Tax=Limtongia smithiae TaxID=1125753 RepID=UPI0034CE2436